MNVEHENFFFAIFASVQRRRRWSGTSFVIAWAKSALITTASARYSPSSVRTPTARWPSNSTSFTSSPSEKVTPSSAAMRAIASDTAEQPPIGCHTPNSYSRNDRIENRLGQLNGDMPEVLRLERERQPDARVAEVAAEFANRATATAAASAAASASRQLEQVAPAEERRFRGTGGSRSSLSRLSARNRRTFGGVGRAELRDLRFACARGSGVQSSWPPRAEDDAVLRVEPHHRHFAVQVAADRA